VTDENVGQPWARLVGWFPESPTELRAGKREIVAEGGASADDPEGSSPAHPNS